MLFVSGPQDWAIQQARYIQQQLCITDALWIGERNDGCNAISGNAYRQFLGREYSGLVINCYSGIRANTLLALSGVIKEQGVMIVICPEFHLWHSYSDPQSKERTTFGYESSTEHNYFVEWLVKNIHSNNTVATLTPNQFKGINAPLDDSQYSKDEQITTQEMVVDKIIELYQDTSPGCLVISADRGRGKSSALGIAAGKLMRQSGAQISITSISPKMVENVFKHAAKEIQTPANNKHKLVYNQGHLRHLAPDAITNGHNTNELLMIDEAATFPASSLTSFLANNPKCIFSTTIHGYEGSGRGFELRFKKQLEAKTKTKSLTLTIPMRWSQNDPLEFFWHNTMFLAKAKTPATTSKDRTFSLREYSSAELINNPTILQQCFQLLIEAHYQTTPDDLMRLLNANEQRLVAMQQGECIIGVCLLAIEGGDKLQTIAKGISEGSRRPNGHLTPQSLAYSYALEELATLRYLRVVRIAVTAEYQGEGRGSELIEYCLQLAKQTQCDFLSTSFGVTAQLFKFWQSNQFDMVKLGLKKDPASGEHSAIFLREINHKGATQKQKMKKLFAAHFHYHQIKFEFGLPPGIFSQLNEDLSCTNLDLSGKEVIQQASLLTKQFVNGTRPLNSCEFAINLILNASTLNNADKQTPINFLRELIVERKAYSYLCQSYQLTGKKQIQQRARQYLATSVFELT